MGGQQPKNSTWFELNVAAYLKTKLYEMNEKSINLTEFYFDVNPPGYTKKLTGAGYPSDVDIIAEKGRKKYNISCKFSQKEDETLKLTSKAFQEVFLEFIPILKAESTLEYHMEFVLATNMRLSQGTRELLVNPSFKKIASFSEKVKRHGTKKYKSRFNADLFEDDIFLQLIKRLAVYKFNNREFEKFGKTKSKFKDAFYLFSKELVRTPQKAFGLINATSFDIIFNCKSETHENCTEVAINNILCHFGDLSSISQELKQIELSFNRKALVISGRMAQFLNSKDLLPSRNISKLEASKILAKAFNLYNLLELPEHFGLFIVPGTWDLVIFNSRSIAADLKKTEDSSFRFHPENLNDLSALNVGPQSLIEITKWAFLLGLNLKIDDSDICINSEIFP